uniref:Transcription factor Spi-C n=1 Tax=Esox lucius TaxID=8010 RepID=A0A3P8XCC4_ESOLU
MNLLEDNQTDLEVILEFLGEYYRQNIGGYGREREGNVYDLPTPMATEGNFGETSCDHWPHKKMAIQSHVSYPASPQDQSNTTMPENQTDETWSHTLTAQPVPTNHNGPVERGRKVRLFHFLFEMLEDPSMAHCVSWVPATAAGVFRFSSQNKDQIAMLWGQRKGNRTPMTYQKMSRALRNYTRSGQIFKVKKKLTYRFSRDTLCTLKKCHQGKV